MIHLWLIWLKVMNLQMGSNVGSLGRLGHAMKTTRPWEAEMSTTGLAVFDETVHLTNTWLKDLMQDLGWEDDRQRAYLGLRLTLQQLRDHLSVDEVAQFSAQLPMLIRGFYYEGWHPAHKPLKERDLDAFLAPISDGFRQNPPDEPIDAAELVSAVFRLLTRRLSVGQTDAVRNSLPKDLRRLWPDG